VWIIPFHIGGEIPFKNSIQEVCQHYPIISGLPVTDSTIYYYHHYTRPDVQTALLKMCWPRFDDDNTLACCRLSTIFSMQFWNFFIEDSDDNDNNMTFVMYIVYLTCVPCSMHPLALVQTTLHWSHVIVLPSDGRFMFFFSNVFFLYALPYWWFSFSVNFWF